MWLGTHASGGNSWMWLVPACMAVTVECVWCLRVWPRPLDVIDTHEFGDASLMWFVPACVAVAVGCGSVLTRVAAAVVYGWRPRICR